MASRSKLLILSFFIMDKKTVNDILKTCEVFWCHGCGNTFKFKPAIEVDVLRAEAKKWIKECYEKSKKYNDTGQSLAAITLESFFNLEGDDE